MKRHLLLAVVVTLSLILAACASASASTNRLRSGARTLTPEAKLAIGTLNLEGTPQAVDRAQAAKLLPLWQLLVQLNSSDSTAPQEVQAVLDQIRLTMSADQLQAMDNMEITPGEALSGFQGQGQANRTGGTNRAGNGSGSSSSSGSRRNEGGQVFEFGGGGGPPGVFGGGGFGGGGNTTRGGNSGATQTASGSAQSAQQASNAVSDFLANRVIRLLESKIQS